MEGLVLQDMIKMKKDFLYKESPFDYSFIELLDPLVHAARLSRQLLC